MECYQSPRTTPGSRSIIDARRNDSQRVGRIAPRPWSRWSWITRYVLSCFPSTRIQHCRSSSPMSSRTSSTQPSLSRSAMLGRESRCNCGCLSRIWDAMYATLSALQCAGHSTLRVCFVCECELSCTLRVLTTASKRCVLNRRSDFYSPEELLKTLRVCKASEGFEKNPIGRVCRAR